MSRDRESVVDRGSDRFAPLRRFYGTAGLLALDIALVNEWEIPQSARLLLCHDTDMTPTLEAFFGDRIHLHVLRQEWQGEIVTRQVTLRLKSPNRAVEFGAIQIDLSGLTTQQKQLVRKGEQPLGTILNDFDIPHESHPSQFFRIKADALMVKYFDLQGPQTLYGRCNTLRHRGGEPLADVVEVLPPLSLSERCSAGGLVPGALSAQE